MSPWNTIRSRLLEYTDSAGIGKDHEWLQQIIEANSRMDTTREVALRESRYLSGRFYAAASDSIKFIESLKEYANIYLLNVDAHKLYKEDSLAFGKALNLKFGTADRKKLGNDPAYSSFLRSYYSNTRMIIDELAELVFAGKKYLIRPEVKMLLRMKEWSRAASELYENNPIYVNPFIAGRVKENFTF